MIKGIAVCSLTIRLKLKKKLYGVGASIAFIHKHAKIKQIELQNYNKASVKWSLTLCGAINLYFIA